MNKIFASTKCLSLEDIQLYLKKALPDEDRFRVENHLLDCELCSHAVEGYANHYQFETHTEVAEVQHAVESPDTTSPPEAKHRQLPPRRSYLNWAAAAALILLIPLAGYLYWQSNDMERLYQAYEPNMNGQGIVALRAEEGLLTQSVLALQGMEYFDQEDYETSLIYYKKALEEDPENGFATFFAGVTSLVLEKEQDALEYLSVARLNHQSYYEDASWFLALAYIKLGNRQEAINLLDDLSKIKNGTYSIDAVELKQQLLQ